MHIYICIYPGRIYQLRYCDITSNQTQKIAKTISNANEISSSSAIHKYDRAPTNSLAYDNSLLTLYGISFFEP